MASGPTYVVKYRRRREGKTDYRKRLKLLKSGKPRIVIRKSIYNIIVQTVLYGEEGDKVLLTTTTKELLKKYDWKYNRNNLPSAYLVGYLHGLKSIKSGVYEGIIDIGLHRKTKGGVLFAVVKGLIDAGLNIPHSKDLFPDDYRIRGEHIVKYAKQLRESNLELYNKQFSRYIREGILPENISMVFEETLNKIKSSF